jgi:6-phosphogluconolactonase (cycloisomerase 2 family)
MRGTAALVCVLAACGDDGVHHLADAPVPPSAKGIYVTQGDNSIVVFALDATGNTAPMRTISGPLAALNLPIGIEFDTPTKMLYVANRQGGVVHVFDAEASGDVAPVRTLTATGLGSAEGVALTPAGDLFVSCCPSCGSGLGGQVGVFHFPAGATTSDYTLGGATNDMTGFTAPGSLAFDSATNELFVGNSFSGNVSVWPMGAKGDTAPVRAFSPGPVNLQSIAYANQALYVTVPQQADGVVLTYDRAATGSPPAVATLPTGGALNVTYPGGIYVDGGDAPKIYVVDYLGNAIHIIETTGAPPAIALGTVTTIVGAATNLNMPLGIRVVR